MLPVGQQLEADDVAGRELDLRLEVRHELTAACRFAQLGDQDELLGIVRVDGRAVGQHAYPPGLGRVHCHLGMPEQRLGVSAVRRVQRDADARVHGERHSLDGDRTFHRLADPLRERSDLVFGFELEDDGELVANGSREERVPVEQHLEPGSDLPEDGVTRAVPEGVVDLPEVVEVEEKDGQALLSGVRTGDREPQALTQVRAIRKSGEVVVEALEVDPVYLAPDPPRHSCKERYEDGEEDEQNCLEHATDPQQRLLRVPDDRLVGLADRGGAAPLAPPSDRRVRLEDLRRVRGARGASGGRPAHDRPARRLGCELPGRSRTDQLMIRGVRHEAVDSHERHAQDLGGDQMRAEEAVELRRR